MNIWLGESLGCRRLWRTEGQPVSLAVTKGFLEEVTLDVRGSEEVGVPESNGCPATWKEAPSGGITVPPPTGDFKA